MPWCLASGKPRASHFGPEPSLFWAGFHRPSRKAVRWDVFFGFDKERTVKASLNWWAFDIFSSFPSLSACWFISWYRWFQFCSDGVPPFLLGYPLHAKSLGCNTAKKHTTHRKEVGREPAAATRGLKERRRGRPWGLLVDARMSWTGCREKLPDEYFVLSFKIFSTI